MKTRIILPLLALLWIISPAFANDHDVSRQELQQLLEKPGHAMTTVAWEKNYNHAEVHWQGRVYKVKRYGKGVPVDILLKVLPSTRLYDTVITVDPESCLCDQLKAGDMFAFDGTVEALVDTKLVKEVDVELTESYGSYVSVDTSIPEEVVLYHP